MNNAGGKVIISYSKQEVIKLTMIDIHNLTKDYGGGKGVFDVSISIKRVKYTVTSAPTEPESPLP